MAGGIFSSMNKVRPGAYINFETESDITISVGERGIATMILPLSWGETGKLIELTAEEFINGNSLAKIGLINTDSEALPIKLALENCNKLLIYNKNSSGGVQATKILGENGITVTAKYAGTFGNKIAILIKRAEDLYTVETYANGYFVGTQTVSTASELVDNDFVTFSKTGTLSVVSSTLLTGGTNGVAEANLTSYFNLLKTTRFNTMAVLSDTEADKTASMNFAKTMREDEGKYIQVVVANADTTNADYEGIINVVNGVVLNNITEVSANTFTAWVAGATAGASITESLTGKTINNATSILNPLDNQGIEEGLKNGKFILSLNQNGTIKVEKDINSLHTYSNNRSYEFSKNRIIRELDTMGSDIEDIWETTYLGKVSNNATGRMLFKSSIINYLTDLQNRGAIDEFNKDLVVVSEGNDIDSIIADITVKPVDSMEFLYLTINVTK